MKRLLRRAQQYLDAGALAQAAECAQEAVRMDADSAEARMLLGMAQLKAGDCDSAAESFAAALERDPANTPAKCRLAMTYARSKRWGEAVQAVEELAGSDPDRPEHSRPASVAGPRKQRQDESESLEIGAQGSAPNASRSAAEMVRQADWPALKAASEARLAKDPSNPNALLQLGMALYRIGQPDRALAAYNQALQAVKKEADKAVVNFNRSTVLMQLGRWREACQTFESLLSLPAAARGKLREESILYSLGYCYRKRNMIKMAQATYEQLNDIDPSYKDVALCLKRLRVPLAARASLPENETGGDRCGSCGQPLPLGATFCDQCGWSAAGEEQAIISLQA